MTVYRSLAKGTCLTFVVLSTCSFGFGQSDLEHGFKNPPKSAKPHTWWHWINGNITKPGITADLEAMKHFGLAGAQIFNVDVGIPAGDKPFMSDSWKDSIAWAFKEAKRLDMEIDIHNGAGWSSSGGPWVKPEYSMQNLTWSETSVHGPTHFDAVLPEPPKKYDYYEDIACYAVRNPANSAFRIDNIRAKAAFDRGDRIAPDAKAIPGDAAIPLANTIRGTVDPTTKKVSFDLPEGDWTLIRMGHTANGSQNEPSPKAGLGLEVDKLSREALDQFWSGMMATAVQANGPISKNGLIGALIDSYEVGSQNWTPKFREEFMNRRGYDPMPYLVAVTGRVIESGDASERFLWDVRRTVCDLFADNYYGYMTELCHKHGLQFSTEGYGNGSFDNLQINGLPDIPMAEFWIGGAATETTKMVSSSAHTYGKNIVGAESFTAGSDQAKWLYDPYTMKALGDKMFSLGINRYIFHRFAHQPWLDVEPGMTMGPWGTNFDRTITWWEPGRAWIDYVSRCQYMLQQGRFVADVLAFEGDDGPNDLPLMRGTTVPAGYDYDGCDSKVLRQARVENGEIVLPSGMRYKLLMLPDTKWTTLPTMQKIDELVRAGATVIGPRPEKSPTLGGYPAADGQVDGLAQKLWSGDTGQGKVLKDANVGQALRAIRVTKDVDSTVPLNWIHRVSGSADIYFVANPTYRPIDLEATFRVAGKRPQLWNPETGKTEDVAVWRTSGNGITVPLRLESAGSTFVVFDGETNDSHYESAKWLGEEDPAMKLPKIEVILARWEAADGSGGVDVAAKVSGLLKSGETTVGATNENFGDPFVNHVKQLHLVYMEGDKRVEKTIPENDALDLMPSGSDSVKPTFTFNGNKVEFWRSGKVMLSAADGKTKIIDGTPTETAITTPWTVQFPPKKGAPAEITLDKLISWPDSADQGVKYFSGTAKYHTTFQVNGGSSAGDEYWLDLGKVKNLAEITLNGHALPTLWKAPFRIEVSKWLKKGSNDLEVAVTNLWPNRLIGDEQYPPDAKYDGPIQEWPEWVKNGTPRPASQRVTFTTWQFFKKDSPLLESGLIGPVKIIQIPTFNAKP